MHTRTARPALTISVAIQKVPFTRVTLIGPACVNRVKVVKDLSRQTRDALGGTVDRHSRQKYRNRNNRAPLTRACNYITIETLYGRSRYYGD